MGVIDGEGEERLYWGGFVWRRRWGTWSEGTGEWLDPDAGEVEVDELGWARATLEELEGDGEPRGVGLDLDEELPEWLVRLVRERAE